MSNKKEKEMIKTLIMKNRNLKRKLSLTHIEEGEYGFITFYKEEPIENHPKFKGQPIDSELGKELMQFIKDGVKTYMKPYFVKYEPTSWSSLIKTGAETEKAIKHQRESEQ